MGSMSVGVHSPSPDEIVAKIGYADGAQSHIEIAGVSIFLHSQGTSLEDGLASLRKLRAESQRLEMYLQQRIATQEWEQREQDRRDAADDMRNDAQAEAHAEAQALGYHDDDCRATIEHDAMLDEIAAQS